MSLVIVGLGNDLLGDDGIGLLIAAACEGHFGHDVAVRQTGRSGLYLIDELQGFDDAIVVDSVIGDRPGTVRELAAEAMPVVGVPSAHYAGLPEALALARHAGLRVPGRLRIFAVEMDAAQTIGSGPRPEVAAAVPVVLARIERAVLEWGYGDRDA